MKRTISILMILFAVQSWAQQAEPLIFRERTIDFGDVEEGKGAVNGEFVFSNNSGRPVKILSVQPSCGCTTSGWTQNAIAQGKSGFIKVSFDPKGRPGYFNKSLTVLTDLDPNPIILQIKGQVNPVVTGSSDSLSITVGNLRLKSKSFNLGTVFLNKEPIVRQFEVANGGKVPIQFLSIDKPAFIKVEAPTALAPGKRTKVKITYDARQKNQFGFASDNIQFTTDDAGSEVKSISVYATIEEFYPNPTPDELAKAPVLLVKEPNVDLGRFGAITVAEKTVTILNNGKQPLKIKALQGNCPCISAEVEKQSIPAGDSTRLKIVFRLQNREGTQQKAITIYSNDPRNPVQRISVLAAIGD